MQQIAAQGVRHAARRGRRLHLGQAEDAPFGLRDDLLPHDEHVVRGEWGALRGRRLRDDAREVVAGMDLADAGDPDDFVARRC